MSYSYSDLKQATLAPVHQTFSYGRVRGIPASQQKRVEKAIVRTMEEMRRRRLRGEEARKFIPPLVIAELLPFLWQIFMPYLKPLLEKVIQALMGKLDEWFNTPRFSTPYGQERALDEWLQEAAQQS